MVRGLVFMVTIVVLAAMTAPAVRAADARRGERLAQSHCAACHSVSPPARDEVAQAPPFDAIARRYGFDADRIAYAIAGPHPKMNFAPDPAEAADIAAYIATQGK